MPLCFLFSCCVAKAVEPLAEKLGAYLLTKLEPLVREEIEKKLLHEAVKLGVEKYLPYFNKHPVLEKNIETAVDFIADAYVFHEMPTIGVVVDKITTATEEDVSAMFHSIVAKIGNKEKSRVRATA